MKRQEFLDYLWKWRDGCLKAKEGLTNRLERARTEGAITAIENMIRQVESWPDA
jgi:hypothetical protein